MSWHSFRQSLVCVSTAESEMVSVVESMTLGRALNPIWIELTQCEPRWVLNVDNLACTHLLALPGGAWRTRHLRLRANDFREAIEQGVLCINHFPRHEMLSDILTKSMAWSRMKSLLRLAEYVLTGEVSDVSVDMSNAVKTPLCIYLASQLPATAEAQEQETELESSEEETSFFLLWVSQWVFFIGILLLGWEFLTWCVQATFSVVFSRNRKGTGIASRAVFGKH